MEKLQGQLSMNSQKIVKTFEEYVSKGRKLDEGLKTSVSQALQKGAVFAREVWTGVKREGRETQEALRLVGELAKGNNITETQKAFIRAQALDLVKAIPLIAIQGIPAPVPITPFLILLGNRVGFNILPDSHTKVDYYF